MICRSAEGFLVLKKGRPLAGGRLVHHGDAERRSAELHEVHGVDGEAAAAVGARTRLDELIMVGMWRLPWKQARHSGARCRSRSRTGDGFVACRRPGRRPACRWPSRIGVVMKVVKRAIRTRIANVSR
ncbi:uncharacterized protein A4U43_C05F2570 [Asparagus officinalis]|uniref:Uncharacterized protein n=1 Tax=Asparagus officinalis TaxID=4686 RepID=A0A5P1ENT5_ASPOF|nr:uncharacterized protein A4U43_C05F2570 [Asparagus officinalis]